MRSNEELKIFGNSIANVLAHALSRLYCAIPASQSTVGNGYYYDFDAEQKISEVDLSVIEDEMKKIIKEDLAIKRKVMPISEGIRFLADKGHIYTAELARGFKIQGEKEITLCEQGDFINLCENELFESTDKLNPDAIKLTKISGVYWKGDEKNKMIQRIYGVAFNNKKELDEYMVIIKEAEKRDHRKLGRELELFHLDENVGLGLPLWHPKGAILWKIIEDFWHKEHLKNGYQLVRSPHIGNRKLWEISGHWGFYNESMYPPIEVGQTLKESQDKQKAKDHEQFLIKPMNCPFHIEIFKYRPHSYRELPLRWAECGTVYRYEKKGELSGLTRVRGFTQDDAHIICVANQVEDELKKVVDFILFIYKSFGFGVESVNVYLSVRDPKSQKYAGTNEGWDFTEKVLEKIASEKRLNINKDVGGAVFYGPKLDFKIKDAIGREWQCSTLQFDFNLPERFDMTFINNKGEKERPYMLHRALFGSFERFIGILIEHYAGAFPVWLSPVQIKIISVGAKHVEYCRKLADELAVQDIRVEVDDSDETVSNKIRKSSAEKIPYTLVIGDKEMELNRLSVRNRESRETREIEKNNFIEEIKMQIYGKNI